MSAFSQVLGFQSKSRELKTKRNPKRRINSLKTTSKLIMGKGAWVVVMKRRIR